MKAPVCKVCGKRATKEYKAPGMPLLVLCDTDDDKHCDEVAKAIAHMTPKSRN